MVSPGATAADSGTALVAAISGITDATADTPYLVKLEPGRYDLGSARLEVPAFVDVEGSGMRFTEITSTSATGTVNAGEVTIRQVRIRNTLAAGAPAIVAAGTRLEFVSVEITPTELAAGTTVAAIMSSGFTRIIESEIAAHAGSGGGLGAGTVEGVRCTGNTIALYDSVITTSNAAVVNAAVVEGGCTLVTRVSRVTAFDGEKVHAVLVEDGGASLNHGTAIASGATSSGRGVLVQSGTAGLRGVDVAVFGSGSAAVETAGASIGQVFSSMLRTDGIGLMNSGTGRLRAGGSMITGGTQGTVTCTTSYDGSYVSPGLNVCP